METIEMKGTEIIRDVMEANNVTQTKLAELMGYASASAVNGRLSAIKISVDRMVGMLSAMGYELIVRKVGETDGREWKVTG